MKVSFFLILRFFIFFLFFLFILDRPPYSAIHFYSYSICLIFCFSVFFIHLIYVVSFLSSIYLFLYFYHYKLSLFIEDSISWWFPIASIIFYIYSINRFFGINIKLSFFLTYLFVEFYHFLHFLHTLLMYLSVVAFLF